jgi:multisubunit Na+/H+ antiporter MnhB subunit
MKPLQVFSLILLLSCGSAVFILFPRPENHNRDISATWVPMATQMGIQNMVTAVYLGPRVFDTFIEVMVVVLTVYGMKFVREHL